MSISVLREIRGGLRNLNPSEVRELAEQRFTIGLLAENESAFQHMTRFLAPPGISDQKARQAGRRALRIERTEDFARCDFGLCEAHLEHPSHFYPFDSSEPGQTVSRFLDRREDLWIPVARHFGAFQDAVVERLIRKIARENALVAVAAAIPNVVPSLAELPWLLGDFASDTAFLTVNQIRLAFLIAAASDAPVGYLEQRGQIASIVTSAFGWRALARELVSKVPFGGGLVPKGLIAFAGTYAVGKGLERYQQVGRGLTAEEKRELYARGYERGRVIVEEIVERWKGRDRPASEGAPRWVVTRRIP